MALWSFGNQAFKLLLTMKSRVTQVTSGNGLPAAATSYTGPGFDACTAPSAAQMQAWRQQQSPYRAVGIYIGGSDRACAQPDLTASWVRQQQAAGWHFMPIYVGPQESFGEITAAARQAASAAQDAVSQAQTLGFGPGSPIYYDMEAYPASRGSQVLRFLTAWTRELHTLQYTSGVYSNSLSGGSAQASPAVAQPTGAVSVFFRGVGGQLWRDSFTPGAGWQHPASMGGSLATRPSAVTSVPGTVAVFAKGTDGRLWEAVSQPGHGWPALRPLHMGRLGSRPAAVAQADGVIDVFWRGSADHHLWQAQYNPGHGWGKAHDLGGQLGSAPAPAVSGRGTLTVFWQGRDGICG